MKELIELYVEKMWRITDKEGYICDLKAESLLKEFVKEVCISLLTSIVLSLNEDDIDRGVCHCTYVRKLLEEKLKVK